MVSLEEYIKDRELPPGARVHMRCVSVSQPTTFLALRIKFDGDFTINGRPLLLRADPPTTPTKETGLRVWDCGILMAKYIDHAISTQEARGQRVIEVGCGTGISGLSYAMKGAHVTLTDLPAVADRVLADIALNRVSVAQAAGSAAFKVLNWARLEEWKGDEAFDVVLASDCVWHNILTKNFTEALLMLCRKAPQRCKVLLAHKVRDASLGSEFFNYLHSRGFQAQRLPHPPGIEVNSQTDIWELRLQA